MNTIRIGTRGSQLAVTQTGQVVDTLKAHHPSVSFETIVIKTTGDLRQNVPFSTVGTKGMFVKEIEEALLSGAIDLAIHSLKDMPGELPDGLELAAVPKRKDPRDALLSKGPTLEELPHGAKVGTSSLRRQVLLRELRPDLQVEELRGNLDTRIRKLDEGQYDAIVLACAGLERMGWAHRITERLAPESYIPAPGQGALALETRTTDTTMEALLGPLHHPETESATRAERAFQAELNAGCSVPAGAYATVQGDVLTLFAFLSASDGSLARRVTETGSIDQAAAIGMRAAKRVKGL